MKILLLFTFLNNIYNQNNVFFLQKIIGSIFSFFFLFEYIILFIFNNIFIYIIIIYKYIIKYKSILFKKKKKVYNNFFLKKNEKKFLYKEQILKIYYHRWMYYGFTIVYLQIFLRKIKENKNYFIYVYYYKLKKMYNNIKKKIIFISLFLFFLNNYNIILYYNYLKKIIFNFIIILSFIKIFQKNLFCTKIYNLYIFFFHKILLKILKICNL